MDFHIPTDYVPEETQRLQLYKRLAAVRDAEERDGAMAEMKDRYGPLPAAVQNLLAHSVLKHRAQSMRIPLLERRGDRLVVQLRADSKVDPERLMHFVAETDGARFRPDGTFEWSGFEAEGAAAVSQIQQLLERLAA